MNDLNDRYGKNFTIRFTTQEREEMDRYSKKMRIRPSTLIRNALNCYYEKIRGDEEIEKIDSTKFDDLPLLVGEVTTRYGRERLAERFKNKE